MDRSKFADDIYTAEQLHCDVVKCEICGREKKFGKINLFGKDLYIPFYDCACVEKLNAQEEDERIEQQRIDTFNRFKHNSDLPTENKTFESWVNNEYTKLSANCFNKYIDFLQDFKTTCKGMLVYGDAGCGKSHLSVALATELAQKGIEVVFKNVPKLFEDIYSSFQNEDINTYTILEPILNAQVVILDDLGAEKITDFVKTKLYYIINSLYNSGATIIVTTNVKKVSDLSDIIGFRAYDRLLEMCDIIHNEGKSYRRYLATKNFKEQH